MSGWKPTTVGVGHRVTSEVSLGLGLRGRFGVGLRNGPLLHTLLSYENPNIR